MIPLIQREFFGILRTRKSLAMLITMTAAFALILLLRWPSDSRIDLSGARSQQVFRIFAYTLMAGVLFVVPAFPAVSFVQEKNKGTLALLLNSPLRSWSIYSGKLVGTLLFSVMLILTSLPAAAACFAMGGLELSRQVVLLYAMLFVCAIQYSTLALLISTFAQSTDSAVRVTYGAVFGLSILAMGPYFLLREYSGLLNALGWWLRAGSPIPVVMDIVGHGDVDSVGVDSENSTTTAFFILGAVTSVAFSLLTIGRLNFRLFDRARSQGTITDDRDTSTRTKRRLLFLVDPQRRKSGIPSFVNPVMVKEFRTRKFGRIHWLLRLVAACAVLSLLLTFAATTGVVDWGVETIGGFLVLLQVLLIVLITPALASSLVSSERESGGWELLRMTPLSAFQVITGKLLSVVWTVALILLATVPGYVVMIYIKPVMWLQVYQILICLAVAAIYTVAVGAAIGSLFKKTATATMTCYVVLIVMFLGPLLVWMGQDAPFTHDTVEAALAINPTGAALNVIGAPGFETYELMPLALWVSGAISALAAICLSVQVWRIRRPV